MDTRQAESRVGQMVDRYRLEKVLGAGGFGAVFRARHLMMQRDVALKLLHGAIGEDDEVYERFLREARTLARLGHPHVVTVYDCGIASGEAYLAMELLEGEDLAARLERQGTVPPDDALRIVEDILNGLAAAHAAGIVHRDMKPANVFLARTAQGEIIKLVDFGISKVDGDRLTRTGTILGTPVYMAPESVLNGAASVDARADLYAVGVILFEMLSGRLPYDAPSYQSLIVKVATELPASLASVAPGVAPEVAALVDRAIARRPEDRFSDALSMRESVAKLRSACAPAVVTPAPTPMPAHVSWGGVARTPSPGPAERRGLGLFVAIGGLGLATIGAALVALFSVLGDVEKLSTRTSGAAPAPMATAAPVTTKPLADPALEAGPKRSIGAAPGTAHSFRPEERGVHVHEPDVIGQAAVGDVFRLVDAAREDLERCRGGRDEQVHVHLHLHRGRISLAGPNPNIASTDPEKARCVANVLRDHGPLPLGEGIVQLAFDLAAR